MTEIKLPEIGEGVTEGELVNWLVNVGDSVEEDQPIVEIMTDKATVEIPSHTSGTVKDLKFQPGDMIEVDSVIMELDGAAAKKSSEQEKKETKKQEEPKVSESSAAATTNQVSDNKKDTRIDPPVAASNVLATPSTRRLARESNLDINKIQGSGLAGRVTREDVLNSSNQQLSGSTTSKVASLDFPRPAFQSNQGDLEERVPLRGIRRKIAENMQMYKRIIPHFSLMDEADVTALVKMREDLKKETEKMGVKVTYLPFLMKAIIAASRKYPMVNASIDDDAGEIVYKKYFNMAFAADTPNGLVVPVIKNADQKSILEISAEIIELANKAREGKLSLEEMKGACLTITNIGSIGGTYATPIINHPEVAIFGMYKITDKPVFVNGKWKARKVMNLSVTADHRLIDGAVAARFMNEVITRLQNPARLMLDLI